MKSSISRAICARSTRTAIQLSIALALVSGQAAAGTILGVDLARFAAMESAAFAHVSKNTINVSTGIWSNGGANTITDLTSVPGVVTSDPKITGGKVPVGNALEIPTSELIFSGSVDVYPGENGAPVISVLPFAPILPSAVPVPSTLLLFGLGLIFAGAVRLLRR